MSHHDLFDMLMNQDAPFSGYGRVRLVEVYYLQDQTKQATDRVTEMFFDGKPQIITPVILDNLIGQMWAEGWSANEQSIDLFSTDFGLLLLEWLSRISTLKFVSRDDVSLNHFSLYSEKHRVEFFPFHKAYKCLSQREGESLAYFAGSIEKILKGNLPN